MASDSQRSKELQDAALQSLRKLEAHLATLPTSAHMRIPGTGERMPMYLRARAPQDRAASVIVSTEPDGRTRARIEWGVLFSPSPITGQTVGASLPVAVALEAAEKGRARRIVEHVVVVIDNPDLWDEAWGELREVG